MIKLGVFTVSMPDYEPAEALRVLKDLGYDGVEWRITTDTGDRAKPTFWSGNRTTMTPQELIERAPELKRQAAGLGLAMPSIGSYIGIAGGDFDAAELNMRAAAAIGARSLRISAGGYAAGESYPAQVAKARAHYARLAELAARHGVRAVIETHMGQLGPSVATARAILDGLDPRHVGIMWDPGNQVTEGSEVYRMAIENAGEYLAEVHAKNARWVATDQVVAGQRIWKTEPAPLREGIVNWPEVVKALKVAGYDGWIFFEDFSSQAPLRERLQDNLGWFRTLIA